MTTWTLFSQQATGASVANDGSSYTLGMQFSLSQAAALTGIWFYSPSSATVLPPGCCIFQETSPGSGTIVPGTSNTSPSWSGAAGSGWVKCSYNGTVTLSSGVTYKVCVRKDTSPLVYSATGAYWSSGPGGSGLANGIITAPNNSGGDGGQDTFVQNVASLTYPASSFNAGNYWIDVEVTTASVSGLLLACFP